eukprot:TRINITY_DN5002_c0_g1_i1.p1 TRINITY_DN5002_c0_g1~~TRINITY_DN5002_c0_g1_i1.p1  ORF type:complete len:945 (+),score=130.73 TRINITY_DN5002_c0_g1_i1:45-2879(+)
MATTDFRRVRSWLEDELEKTRKENEWLAAAVQQHTVNDPRSLRSGREPPIGADLRMASFVGHANEGGYHPAVPPHALLQRRQELRRQEFQNRLTANRDWLEPPLRPTPSTVLPGFDPESTYSPRYAPPTLPTAVTNAALSFPAELRDARKIIKVTLPVLLHEGDFVTPDVVLANPSLQPNDLRYEWFAVGPTREASPWNGQNDILIGSGPTLHIPAGTSGKKLFVKVSSTRGEEVVAVSEMPIRRRVTDSRLGFNGSFVEGETLTLDLSSINSRLISEIRWYRDGTHLVSLRNATNYDLLPSDVGCLIRADVLQLDGQTLTATSPEIVQAHSSGYFNRATVVSQFTLEGRPVEGNTIRLVSVEGEVPVAYSRWFCGDELVQEGGLSYEINAPDVGRVITVEFRRRNDEPTCTLVTAPVVTGPPIVKSVTLVGDAVVGSALTVQAKYAGGKQGDSIVQWYRMTDRNMQEPIKAGPDRSLTLTESDVGCLIRCTFIPVRTDGERGMSQSAVTDKPVRRAFAASLPRRTGECRLSYDSPLVPGTRVRARIRGLDGSPELDCAWYRNGVRIAGANQLHYTLTETDVGKNVSFEAVPIYNGNAWPTIEACLPAPIASLAPVPPMPPVPRQLSPEPPVIAPVVTEAPPTSPPTEQRRDFDLRLEPRLICVGVSAKAITNCIGSATVEWATSLGGDVWDTVHTQHATLLPGTTLDEYVPTAEDVGRLLRCRIRVGSHTDLMEKFVVRHVHVLGRAKADISGAILSGIRQIRLLNRATGAPVTVLLANRELAVRDGATTPAPGDSGSVTKKEQRGSWARLTGVELDRDNSTTVTLRMGNERLQLQAGSTELRSHFVLYLRAFAAMANDALVTEVLGRNSAQAWRDELYRKNTECQHTLREEMETAKRMDFWSQQYLRARAEEQIANGSEGREWLCRRRTLECLLEGTCTECA